MFIKNEKMGKLKEIPFEWETNISLLELERRFKLMDEIIENLGWNLEDCILKEEEEEEEEKAYCPNCGAVVLAEDMQELEDGTLVCQDCYEEADECHLCGMRFLYFGTIDKFGNKYCDYCAREYPEEIETEENAMSIAHAAKENELCGW